ncbi:MAG: HD-GYP domain-containing protein [Coriobacteriia bacterium]|nr:HD-GYP domain-containing protein [Coriobacteriia bacterium]
MISGRMRVYLWFVVLISVLVWTLILPVYRVNSWPAIILLALLAFALSSMAVELPLASSISMIYAALFAALVYAGPVGAGVVGMISGFSVREFRERKAPLLMIGNSAQLSLSAIAAGLVFQALGGGSLYLALGRSPDLTISVIASIAATTTFFAVNLILITIGISLRTEMRLGGVLRTLQPTSYWVSLLVLTLLGFTMAVLLALKSWIGLLLLVLPFWMARRTFRVYVELSEAYASTVRSLVTAIEAKDPYTKGHSERVADYSRKVAERMGMSHADVDLLERAALLHDIGKIGISLDTLVSPDELTPEELSAIRQHPALGSNLVADVEFLNDIVGIVRHHHERYDGAGYPDGLAGERIPLLARILAVADSYDAMTSNRAYRPRLSRTEAREELHRVAGSQLDSEIVSHFSEMLTDLAMERSRA